MNWMKTGAGRQRIAPLLILLGLLFMAGETCGAPLVREPVPQRFQEPAEGHIWEIPVVVILYLPTTDGLTIDVARAPDYWQLGHISVEAMRDRIFNIIYRTMRIREKGSRFRGYRNPRAKPSIGMRVEALFTSSDLPPASSKSKTVNGQKIPFPDYASILNEIDARAFVEKGVKEFWMWSTDIDPNFPAYIPAMHKPEYFRALWESNMAGPHGDISNSDQDPGDLPTYSKTYTLYNYNIRRTETEAIHNYIHQIERIMNFLDGRHRTPKNRWQELLFWGRFVGSDASKKIVRPGCGWAHYPPNAEKGYDYANTRFVSTDMEDWRPDGGGNRRSMNCQRWNCEELQWHLFWMQSLPGHDNRLTYKGHPLENWWQFLGNFDDAMAKGLKLVRR